MNILHRTPARRLRLAFRIGCAIVAIIVFIVKDPFFNTWYGMGVLFLIVVCLFYTYILLLRTQRQRAEKSTHGHWHL